MSAKYKLLLVEDNHANQVLLARQLGMLGCDTETVADGRRALQKIAETSYDLILTDCNMPVMNGYEMSRKIRESENDGVRVPIIAITADAVEGTAERCREAGMDQYLTKPIQVQMLESMLAKWIPAGDFNSGSSSEAAAAGTATVADDVVDEQSLPNLLGLSDPFTLVEYYTSFIESAEEIMEDLQREYVYKNLIGVGDNGHKLKSSARAIGANKLADCCLAIEKAGREENAAAVDELMQQIPVLYAGVRQWIESYVKTYS